MTLLSQKLFVGLFIGLTAVPVVADYPERPFQIIVEPFSDATESLLSEMLAEQIEKSLQQIRALFLVFTPSYLHASEKLRI